MEHLNGCLPLSIGGKQRNLYFTYTFAGVLFKIVPEQEFDKVIKETPFRLLPLITFAALQTGADENDLPEGFSERMAEGWLMGVPPEKVGQILDLFEHSMGFIMQSLQRQAPAEKAKKAGVKPSL